VRLFLLVSVLAVLTSACVTRRYTDLPELPPVPHDFNSLTRHFRAVTVEGHAEPILLSWVEAGEGPPLLLVHGLMTSAYSWRYVASSLARHYRVIAIDLPGAGRSGAPSGLSQSPQRLAAVLDAFVQALGLKKTYVVGNSMGGYVALWWSLAHPERFERLLIMHSPGFPEPRLYALHAILSSGLSKPLFRWLTRDHEQFALDNVHYRNESLKSREETREYARWTSTPERLELFRRNLLETMDPWTMRGLPAAVEAQRAERRLVPMRLLWSRADPLVSPKFGPRYQLLLPEAELVWIEDTSHFMHVDTPEAAAREILRYGHIQVSKSDDASSARHVP
jgi:pimeloyl-ACP methyl ester carboxylesterase